MAPKVNKGKSVVSSSRETKGQGELKRIQWRMQACHSNHQVIMGFYGSPSKK
ncbi:hypothetical protein HAX54_016626, partial [Datura stramonium]|nr:hypothetical protein [Datura stramonium]